MISSIIMMRPSKGGKEGREGGRDYQFLALIIITTTTRELLPLHYYYYYYYYYYY